MKNLCIDGILVTEGQKYKHKTSGCIWTVKQNFYNTLIFDSGILERQITKERLAQLELITE